MNKGCSDLFASFILKTIALTPNRDHTYLINKYISIIDDGSIRAEVKKLIKEEIKGFDKSRQDKDITDLNNKDIL